MSPEFPPGWPASSVCSPRSFLQTSVFFGTIFFVFTILCVLISKKSKARLSGRAKPSTQKLLHSDGRTAIRRRVCPREAAHTKLLRKPSGADGASSSKDHRAEAIDLFCESPAEPDFRFDNTAMLSIGAQI